MYLIRLSPGAIRPEGLARPGIANRWQGFFSRNRRRGSPLPPETSAKERVSGASRVLRWVPDRLPLRFAALQASGKAVERPSANSTLPGACSESGMRPGTRARLRREAAPNSFRRGLLRQELHPAGRRSGSGARRGWGMILDRLAAVPGRAAEAANRCPAAGPSGTGRRGARSGATGAPVRCPPSSSRLVIVADVAHHRRLLPRHRLGFAASSSGSLRVIAGPATRRRRTGGYFPPATENPAGRSW